MNVFLLAIASGASLVCSPISVAPYMGHWQRLDSKKDTMDITRQNDGIVVKLFTNGHKESERKGIQTVDGRLVVQSSGNLAIILIINKAKRIITAGSYTYVKI